MRLRNLDADNVEEFCIDDAKAVFLVKSFRGNSDHNPLHFHTHVRTVQGLWVRIVFYDDEVMEGIVHNTSHYVLQKGFLLIPTDPRTNNRLVYVLKAKLKNFEVLGMRNPPKGSHRF